MQISSEPCPKHSKSKRCNHSPGYRYTVPPVFCVSRNLSLSPLALCLSLTSLSLSIPLSLSASLCRPLSFTTLLAKLPHKRCMLHTLALLLAALSKPPFQCNPLSLYIFVYASVRFPRSLRSRLPAQVRSLDRFE
jgi:hypothetical protein